MGGGVVAMVFLFMIILLASPSPSSCARSTWFPATNSFRNDDDAMGYYNGDEQVGAATSSSFNNKEDGDDLATPYTFNEDTSPLANRQTDDDFQAFQEAWGSTLAASTFNVKNYGAVGDGQADDTQAFLKAWRDVCGSNQGTPTLVIPKGNTFLLNSLVFQGPCRAASLNFQLNGNLVAPNNMNDFKEKDAWVQFDNVGGLIINGGGQIDGQGQAWWKTCDSTKCKRPTALHLDSCDGLRLSDIIHINSAKNHISISSSNNVEVSRIRIMAPEESPNTDGIDISKSTNVNIQQSFIGTGDDCVAINGGSSHINITDVICGPGHGLSVGSLGKNGANDVVEDVQVRGCTLKQTTNGARIKTWKGGSGYARNIIFEDIKLQAVKNPIIITQKYVDKSLFGTLQDEVNAIAVSDVTFRRFSGSVAGDVGITLECDDEIGCKDVVMDHIDLYSCEPGKQVSAYCKNVQGSATSVSPDVPCL